MDENLFFLKIKKNITRKIFGNQLHGGNKAVKQKSF